MKKFFIITFIIFLLNNLGLIGAVRNVPSSYTSIQMALDSCIAGDTVLVTSGIYYENILWPSTNGLKLIGSSGRDSTFIVSDTLGRVILINGGGNIIDTSTEINGFTISNRLNNIGVNHGGGLVIFNGSIKLSNLTVAFNYLSGLINSSWTSIDGAGLLFLNSNSIISNCKINNNVIDSADRGGGAGVYQYLGYLEINNSELNFNYLNATSSCYGSGLNLIDANANIIDTEIKGNYGNSVSWCHGIGIYAWSSGGNNLSLNRVKIDSNHSGNNSTWNHGVGAYFYNVKCDFTNVLVANNSMGTGNTQSYGGGVYYSAYDTLFSTFNHVTIANNVKVGNGKIDGRGVYLERGRLSIQNSILYNPGLGVDLFNSTSLSPATNLTVQYSNIRGGYQGVGNINSNPNFIDSTNFRLSNNSACVNSGTLLNGVSDDLENNSRPLPLNSLPDMGCYEINQILTDISDIDADSEVTKVFPNPIIRGGSLSVSGITANEIEITNVNGSTVYPRIIEVANNKVIIQTSELSSGLYIINSLGKALSQKFIVID